MDWEFGGRVKSRLIGHALQLTLRADAMDDVMLCFSCNLDRYGFATVSSE